MASPKSQVFEKRRFRDEVSWLLTGRHADKKAYGHNNFAHITPMRECMHARTTHARMHTHTHTHTQ